ncbi:DUF1304 domain-containing protein [Alteromonadaceae bacterium BrNp21-10]|nr:DUF1304 domain-containing protein [Alteromonadaceae bacterium BrNp21-10]
MAAIITTLIVIIAMLHLYFLILEMFLWDKPAGMRAFKLSLEHAQRTKAMAANQGLYNGFLSAGLLWGLIDYQHNVLVFFLSCVSIAGVFGALTVSKKIFYIQALPAIIALTLLVV